MLTHEPRTARLSVTTNVPGHRRPTILPFSLTFGRASESEPGRKVT